MWTFLRGSYQKLSTSSEVSCSWPVILNLTKVSNLRFIVKFILWCAFKWKSRYIKLWKTSPDINSNYIVVSQDYSCNSLIVCDWLCVMLQLSRWCHHSSLWAHTALCWPYTTNTPGMTAILTYTHNVQVSICNMELGHLKYTSEK